MKGIELLKKQGDTLFDDPIIFQSTDTPPARVSGKPYFLANFFEWQTRVLLKYAQYFLIKSINHPTKLLKYGIKINKIRIMIEI